MDFQNILAGIYSLPPASSRLLASAAEMVAVDKNTEIVTAGKVCRDIYLVAKGIARAFYIADGREITFWIGAEGSVALSLRSYVDGLPGYETIVTIEDSVLYRLPIERLETLYQEDIHIANWGRKFAEKEILRAEKALIPQLFTTGRERYEVLLREQPGLLNRIPLEILATYLGITAVSLSRIRGQIARGRS
ncbi:MAG: Crp/Fnr family transcriptional regulator [[Clostridium] fimetarium]|nr:Crp/Fnr family transcriptional regulator [Alistipes timonensis]MCM1404824.1 Crp/Fnr family transcriptional regulator [[Clostridium] fimetarium]